VSGEEHLLDRASRAIARYKARGGGRTSAITGRGAVAELESRFAAMTGRRYALALPSGTAALRVAFQVLGVGAGDEVIVEAYGWPAMAAAVRSLGATPVAVDIDPERLTADPGSVSSALTPRTRAVGICHLFGLPAPVPEIARVAPGIPIVEDCAQAVGTLVDGRAAGSLGTLGAFSLGPGKAVDAGEGGVLVSDDPLMHRAAVAASQHPLRQLLVGISTPDPGNLAMRIHPLAPILALEALDHLDCLLRTWAARARALHFRLASAEGVTWPKDADDWQSSWYAVPILLRDAAARRALEEKHDLHIAAAGASLLPRDYWFGDCPGARRVARHCAVVAAAECRPDPADDRRSRPRDEGADLLANRRDRGPEVSADPRPPVARGTVSRTAGDTAIAVGILAPHAAPVRRMAHSQAG
jgi:dTDP-4-amino-4,6-dideoxygalactose transaminase